jgi:putative endonuclease
MPKGFVYIMANEPDGTLYVGVTSDLIRRAYEHRESLAEGFTKKYGLKRLVHFEIFDDIRDAIAREKQLKAGNRARKVEIIRSENPEWKDLYGEIA